MSPTDALKLLNEYLQQYGYSERFTLDMDPAEGVGLTSACIGISSDLQQKGDHETSWLIDDAQNILDDYFCKIWEQREGIQPQPFQSETQHLVESQNSLHFTYNNTRDLSTPTDANQPLLSDNHPTIKPTKPR